ETILCRRGILSSVPPALITRASGGPAHLKFNKQPWRISNTVRRTRAPVRIGVLWPQEPLKRPLYIRLSVVQGGNKATSRCGGERRSSLSDLGYFEREAISLNRLVEFVQESLRLGSTTAEYDRYGLINLGHVLGFGQGAAQAFYQLLYHFVVVDM